MNYDKVTYLFWSIIVFILIFASSFLINYGRNIISSENFGMFFSWYAALIVINLFNILLNLIYHFFMKDLVGPRGIISKSVFSSYEEGPFNVVTSAAPANTITGSVIYKE